MLNARLVSRSMNQSSCSLVQQGLKLVRLHSSMKINDSYYSYLTCCSLYINIAFPHAPALKLGQFYCSTVLVFSQLTRLWFTQKAAIVCAPIGAQGILIDISSEICASSRLVRTHMPLNECGWRKSNSREFIFDAIKFAVFPLFFLLGAYLESFCRREKKVENKLKILFFYDERIIFYAAALAIFLSAGVTLFRREFARVKHIYIYFTCS